MIGLVDLGGAGPGLIMGMGQTWVSTRCLVALNMVGPRSLGRGESLPPRPLGAVILK